MSSWEIGIGGGAAAQGDYPYKSGPEIPSSEIHHNTGNPPPFRRDVLPMPISSHSHHHIPPPSHLLDPSAPPTLSSPYGHHSLAPTTLQHHLQHHHAVLGPPPPVLIPPPHIQHYVHGSAGDLSLHSPNLPFPSGHHHPDPYHGLKLPSAPTVQAAQVPVPGPLTPQGTPGPHPFANMPAAMEKGPELPTHLVEQGWTKCWSKREGRYYFFNCNTNESIWELPGRPHHAHHYDPMTDPLGIQHGGLHAGMKRRASSGEHMGSPPAKRAILSGPWDLEVNSNVYTKEPQTPNHEILPPHPQIELLRHQLVIKLRQCYQQACKSREQIEPPKESLNRWLMEQKINDLKVDPLFPCCEARDGVISQSMFKEIMNDVPMKVVKPRFTGDARKQLAKFAEACKKAIETRSASSDHRKLVKWKAEETFTWLRETVGAPYEAFQERMAHLKEIIQPLVHEAARTSVEGICKKVSVISGQYAREMQEAHLKILVDPQNVRTTYPAEVGRYKSQAALCGEYQFKEEALPQPDKPLVNYLHEKDNLLIKHKNEVARISVAYVQKLDALYKYHTVEKAELFLTRVYCLAKRYNAFCNDYLSCQSTQGSIPTPVFESIQRNFGVTFECFSSPFNCYFRNYCSAFPDTDGYFGSSGSFLDFRPISGSFQMNPPLCDDLITAAITHAENLLTGTQEPMSFVIFVPEFDGKDAENHQDSIWINRLQNSVWKRKQVTLPAYEHEYRSGSQHIVPKSEVCIRSSHATVVFWLQNDAGFEEWKPTEERVDSLIDAYRPGRERERDRQELLAPERQNPHQEDKAVAAAKAVGNSNPPASGLPPPAALPTNA